MRLNFLLGKEHLGGHGCLRWKAKDIRSIAHMDLFLIKTRCLVRVAYTPEIGKIAHPESRHSVPQKEPQT